MKMSRSFLLNLLAAISVLIGGSTLSAADNGVVYRIRNAWEADQNGPRPEVYINIEEGSPAATTIKDGWLSARWYFEQVSDVNGTRVFHIKSRWKPDLYLHVQNGKLECTTILPGWQSAWWALESGPVAGSFRIKNQWRPDTFLHVQNGPLEASKIQDGWLSAAWFLEKSQ